MNEPVNIYGNMVYSEDSSLCKAAAHMGVLTSTSFNKPSKFVVVIERGRNLYEPATKKWCHEFIKKYC